jgi:hypothetical protein
MVDNVILKKNLEWYISQQEELVKKYNGKVLLIKDCQLIESYETMEEAFLDATSRFDLGTFTLQPCTPGPESYTITIFSPQYCTA